MFMRSIACATMAATALVAQGTFESRLAELESLKDRYFRGPGAEALRERSNAEIEAFNQRTKQVNAELGEARAAMEKALEPGRSAYAELEKADAELKAMKLPSGEDREGTARYAARIEARNALARKVNELNGAGQKVVDDFNARAARAKADLEAERTRVLAEQAQVNAKVEAFEAWAKRGEDVTFFIRVNHLLADVRIAQRKVDRPELATLLVRVRALRRELAEWAIAGQALNPKGLVVVEAVLEDEPVWLIVDTGATDTVIGPELADAVGIGTVSESVSLTVVGGLRLQGRQFRIPQLQVAGHTARDVSASAIRPAEVGLDGLLGQSFLKRFVVTLDPGAHEPLSLKHR